MTTCPCGNPDGTNKECERCRLIAEIRTLKNVLGRVVQAANKMAGSGAADRCRAGNDMIEILNESFEREAWRHG